MLSNKHIMSMNVICLIMFVKENSFGVFFLLPIASFWRIFYGSLYTRNRLQRNKIIDCRVNPIM
jgi:hypothetical protein